MTSRAFTLIELLVVVALMAVLSAMVLPSVTGLGAAGGITRGGEMVADAFVLARQEALTRNRDVEVRFIDVTENGVTAPRAVQLWIWDATGTNTDRLATVQRLPSGIIIASNSLSPLLGADTNAIGTANFGPLGTSPYRGVRIRSTGLPRVLLARTNNFLTVQAERSTGTPPANFAVVRLNGATGRVNIIRP